MQPRAERRQDNIEIVTAYAAREAIDISDKCTPAESALVHAKLLKNAGNPNVEVVLPNNRSALVTSDETDANYMFTGQSVQTSWLESISPRQRYSILKQLIERLDGIRFTRPDNLANIQINELAASILRFVMDDAETHIQAANIEVYGRFQSSNNRPRIIRAESHFTNPNTWKNWHRLEGAKAPVNFRIANGRLHIEFSFNEGREAWLKSDIINVRQDLPKSAMAALVGRTLGELVDFASVGSHAAASRAIISSATSHIPLLTSFGYESPSGPLSELLKAA